MRIALVIAMVLSLPTWGWAGAASGPLAKVDWANRDYGRRMKLKNGRDVMRRYPHRSSPLAKRCRHTTQSTRLVKVHHVDLHGDRSPEALVELSTYSDMCNGRASKHRVLIGFEWRSGAPHEFGRFTPSGVSHVRVKGRRIHVDRREARQAGWFECSDVWRYRKGAFVLVSSKCAPK